MVSVMEAQEATVKAPTFPKWYIEAPLDEAPSENERILMNEARTALLDYPDLGAISELTYGCVRIFPRNDSDRLPLLSFLYRKGFQLGTAPWEGLAPDTYPVDYSYPSNHIVICGRKP